MPARARYTVVVAADHAVVRQGLRVLLETEADPAVVGEAGDLEETERLFDDLAPDILLLDLHAARRRTRPPRAQPMSPASAPAWVEWATAPRAAPFALRR